MKKSALYGVATFLAASQAFAQEAVHNSNTGTYAIAAALAIGLAAVGGAIAQGLIGSSAMDGIARNPQASKAMFVPMIICLALVESLVIYGLVIAFMLNGKI